VIEAASDPEVGVPELGRLVSSDPVLAAQLLRTVNSGLYRRGVNIRAIDRAVSVLGIRSLRNIALCVAVRGCVHKRELGDFDLARFWEDSLRRAVAGQILAESSPSLQIDPMEAFTIGLLQDLGVLALIRRHPDRGAAWMEAVGWDPERRREHERALFGRTHDEVAAQLATAWKLPGELAVPMCCHHRPEQAKEHHRARCRIAWQAELLATVLGGDDKRAALGRAREALRGGAVDPDQIVGELGQRVALVAADLGFSVGVQPTLESILQAANTGLIELNLSYEELVVTLERTLAEKEELARQLEQRNRELEQLSLTDELTGLPNRRALSGRLSYEIKRAARGDNLVFMVADLDRFKQVNDTWGHEFGDKVLAAVGAAMLRAVRDTDMVARLGGEEFGIVLPGTDLAHAMIAAERVLAAVRAIELSTPDGRLRRYSISLGLAGVEGPYTRPVMADRVATRLYKSADAALYRAKEGGRDRATPAGEPVAWVDATRAAA
jgi:diguanylate cyclase (GGDEF)-like protein